MAEHEKQYHNERIVRISSSSSTADDGQSITLEGKLTFYRQRLKE